MGAGGGLGGMSQPWSSKKDKPKRKKKVPQHLGGEPFVFVPPPLDPETTFHDASNEFVLLRLRLVTWSYMDSEGKVSTATPVLTIKDIINRRHGGTVRDIVLYKDQVLPINIIRSETDTLDDLGVIGGAFEDGDFECVIYYDFTPFQSQCPLLMADGETRSR